MGKWEKKCYNITLRNKEIFRRFIQHARRGQASAIRVSDGDGTGWICGRKFSGRTAGYRRYAEKKKAGEGQK